MTVNDETERLWRFRWHILRHPSRHLEVLRKTKKNSYIQIQGFVPLTFQIRARDSENYIRTSGLSAIHFTLRSRSSFK